MDFLDKVFVSHWPPLVDRRKNLERSFRKAGIEAEWVTQYDKRTLTREIVSKYYKFDPEIFAYRTSLGGRQRATAPFILNPSVIANTITHIHFLREIVDRGYETTLILEDDIILDTHFTEKLQHYMKQLLPNWDVLYPGSGGHLHVPNPEPHMNVYLHPNRNSRTADSYLIRRSAAEKILSTIVPFVLPIDWELHFHQVHHDLQVYWGEPSITAQGSETGAYQESYTKVLLNP